MKKHLSVIIPTYRVKKIIESCLKSLQWADEIIIVDMFSEDGTPDICRKFSNVKVVQRHDYIFANVNFGIDMAASEWVMRWDSDEIMTEELHKEIMEVLEKDGYGYDGFYCKCRLFMFGKEVKRGVGKYTYRKQIFKKGHARYEVRGEHEEMESKGKWGYLKNPYLHYSYDSVSSFIRKTRYYTAINSEEPEATESPAPSVYVTIYKCIRFFVLFYFQWYGFMDGWHGLLVSFFRGPYYIWQDDKMKRLFKKRKYKAQGPEKHYKAVLEK